MLGSWIGFRRSLNRPTYQLKFFNLPLVRFFVDQLMLILYFRIATLTPDDPEKSPPGAGALAKHTAYILTLIFVLYLLWDFGGILMGAFGKYPNSKPDPAGFAITALVLIAIGAMWLVLRRVDVGRSGAEISFAVASVLLLAYRFLKELRTSVRLVKPKPAGP